MSWGGCIHQPFRDLIDQTLTNGDYLSDKHGDFVNIMVMVMCYFFLWDYDLWPMARPITIQSDIFWLKQDIGRFTKHVGIQQIKCPQKQTQKGGGWFFRSFLMRRLRTGHECEYDYCSSNKIEINPWGGPTYLLVIFVDDAGWRMCMLQTVTGI